MISFGRSTTVADGGFLVRMKYHVYSVLANIGAALPCISAWSSGLPRVTGQSCHSQCSQCNATIVYKLHKSTKKTILIIIKI